MERGKERSITRLRTRLMERVRLWKKSFRVPVYLRLIYLVRVLEFTRKFTDTQQVTTAISFFCESEARMIVDICLAWIKKQCPGREVEFEESRDDSGDYALLVYMFDRCRPVRSFMYSLLLEALTEGCRHAKAHKVEMKAMNRRLDELARVFSLSRVERDLVFYFHNNQVDGVVCELYECLSNLMHIKSRYMISHFGSRPISILTGIRLSDVNKALSSHSVLRRLQLINDEGDLASEVEDYLTGRSKTFVNEYCFRRFKGKALPLGMHMVSPDHLDTVLKLTSLRSSSRGINILLYGEPGTGKTEFTKSLSRHLGTELYFVNSGSLDANPYVTRLRSLTACMNAVDHFRTMLVVDECDSLLCNNPVTGNSGKCLINSILDSTRGLVFWITNSIDMLDSSTARRFDFAVAFRKFTEDQHIRVWKNSLQRHKMKRLLSSEDIKQFASAFKVSAGTVDTVLRNVSASLEKGIVGKESCTDMIRTMLKAQTALNVDIPREETKAADQCHNYSLEGLNIRGNAQQVLSMIDNFNTRLKAQDPALPVKSMNLLLYGPPGTGKTEFARYLAGRLQRKLDLCRMSDILGKYVGESEKNIRETFGRAQRRGAVLFIDEADGLLCTRDNAHHTWEITQVNELLTSMEQFRGILLCATNLRDHLDSASLRRFTLKLEFDYLTPDGAEIFYRRILASFAEEKVDQEVLQKVRSSGALTPGDFKNVHFQVSLTDRGEVSHEMMVDLLRCEASQRKGNSSRVIGFCGKGRVK
ncbi:MAG: AAA family ATPase [Chitinispirillaceae bacterium]